MDKEKIKETSNFFSRLGFGYFILLGLTIADQLIVALVIRNNPAISNNSNLVTSLMYIPQFLISYPVGILIIKKLLPEVERIEKKKLKFWQFLVCIVICYSTLYIGNIIGELVTWVISIIKGDVVINSIVNIITSSNIWVQLVFMVILPPVFEEYIYRKLLIDRALKYGELTAILLSASAFGLMHGNLNQFFYAFFMGIIFSYIYIRTGSIKYTISIHIILNFMGSVLASKALKLIDFQKIQDFLNNGQIEAYMNYVMENMLSFMIYGCYVLFLLLLTISGVILAIVFKKKFYIKERGEVIPRGCRFKTMVLNPGILLFIALTFGLIIHSMIV